MEPEIQGETGIGRVSASYARVAAGQLRKGDVGEALKLCIEGAEQYPWYPAGALILGRCYEELGRTVEAMLEYRRGLRLLPDNRELQKAVERTERREQDEFQAFAEQQVRTLKTQKNALTFDRYVAESGGDQDSTVAFLLKQVQGAAAPATAEAEETDRAPGAPRFVTETLAEIYASQGEYREAIEAYSQLIERRPTEAERYRKRMAELEERAASEKPLE
jgi:tetratricopeptide (TPR) repeat protein